MQFNNIIFKIADNAKPSTAAAFPNIIFIFDIEGVEKYKVDDVTKLRAIK